ncbi:type II secretion system F family protein [Actinospica robiniae]|uniref:type II secretion system F family protein n=1 Tax=Actinospica robiniae TaxID=304901 RepID=UPI0009FCC696
MEIALGALVGLGVFLLIRALIPSRPSAAVTVAQIDALRELGPHSAERRERAESVRELIGRKAAEFYASQGWQMRSLRADLAILDRGWEAFLTTKLGLAAVGFFLPPLFFVALWLVGFHLSALVPVWLALCCAALFFVLPDLEVRRDAKERRADFRRVVTAFLDLVSMNLSGGRGLPEAIMSAAEISNSWAVRRIRDALTAARLSGQTQWAALSALGDTLGVEELVDLGHAIALTADDGAKIRQSLASRAETMRRRELAEIEGKAGQQSQSMLVAQLLLCTGFLIYLIFPAIMQISGLR